MSIKITVVIPTYRRPELLVNCLTALSAQEIDKSCFEVIVVHDGPDYLTAQAIKKWVKKRQINLIFINTPIQRGPAAARNLGWLHAKARVIAFTDDDCIPDKRWLKHILKAYNEEEQIAFTGKTVVPVKDNPKDFEVNTAQLEKAEFITANCACTKKALISIGGFDEDFRLAWREDSDLHFKLIAHKIPIFRLHDALVIHPVRKAKWGISLKEQKKGIYDALLFKKHPQLYKEKLNPKPLINYYLTVLSWFLFVYAIYQHSPRAITLILIMLFLCIGTFIYKRLKNTSKSITHVIEMLITSLIIPFLSLYWRFYGAIKFRVLFI